MNLIPSYSSTCSPQPPSSLSHLLFTFLPCHNTIGNPNLDSAPSVSTLQLLKPWAKNFLCITNCPGHGILLQPHRTKWDLLWIVLSQGGWCFSWVFVEDLNCLHCWYLGCCVTEPCLDSLGMHTSRGRAYYCQECRSRLPVPLLLTLRREGRVKVRLAT